MRRLFLCTGPWHLVMAAAALESENSTSVDRDTNVVLYYAYSGEVSSFFGQFKQTADACGVFDETIDLSEHLERVKEPLAYGAFRKSQEKMRSVIGLDSVDEVWSINTSEYPFRYVFDAYRSAAVVYFEEGAFTYSAGHNSAAGSRLEALKRSRLVLFLKSAAKLLLGRKAVFQTFFVRGGIQPAKRRSRAYLWSAQRLGVPDHFRGVDIRTIDPTSMRAVLGTIADDFGVTQSIDPTPPAALVMGQCFAFLGNVEWGVEYRAYADIVGSLVEKGYCVYWKEHPRNEEPYLAALQEEFSEANVRPCEIDHRVPIEVFAVRNEFVVIAGATSTSLINLDILDGSTSQVVTFAREMAPIMGPTFDPLVAVFSGLFGDLSSVRPVSHRYRSSNRSRN